MRVRPIGKRSISTKDFVTGVHSRVECTPVTSDMPSRTSTVSNGYESTHSPCQAPMTTTSKVSPTPSM